MTNKKGLLLLLSILILLILPFFILCFYIHPSADDYGFTHLVKAFGRWGYQSFMYNNWQGRYFANFIFSFNPLTFDSFIGYKIFSFVLLIAVVLSSVYFIFSIFRNQSTSLLKVIISLLLLLVFVNVIPSPSEAFYWITGSIEYFIPCIFTLVFLSIIIQGLHGKGNKLLNIFIAAFLGFCICGCNEINMIFIIEITALITLYNLKNSNVIRFILPVLIVVIISDLLDILAPGNFIRMSNFSNAHNIVYACNESIISMSKLVIIHFKSASFILISILSFPVLSAISGKRDKPLIAINPWIACIVFGVILFSFFFPVAYSTGLPSPLRIYNTASLLFIIGWFYLIYLFIYHYNLSIQIPSIINSLLTIACIIFLVTGFYKEPGKKVYFSGNIARAFNDVAFNAPKYNDKLNNRYEIISRSKASGKLSLTVPELTVNPSTIHFIDISGDTTSWINIGTAQYFELRSIRINKK